MVIFQILLLSDKRVISKERNTVRASNPRASLTWTDNTSKVGYVFLYTSIHFKYFFFLNVLILKLYKRNTDLQMDTQ